jgi:hypothetical protein
MEIVEFAGKEFRKVPGGSDVLGDAGTLYTYTVYVEKGTDEDPVEFAREVESIIADKRGWIRSGKVAFQQVPKGANTQLVLATPDTVDRLCYPLNTEGEVSCCQGTKVVINVERWRHAVPHWPGRVKTYRQMLCNHEFGHRIGKGHAYCPEAGKRAPCMMQQTYGLGECRANSWPLNSEL